MLLVARIAQVSETQQSTSTLTVVMVVIALLLGAILVTLMKQNVRNDPEPAPAPVDDSSEIDPVVEAQCRDLLAQMENADNRADEATNATDQGKWADVREDLDGRYLKVCDEYDTWARQSGDSPYAQP